MVFAGPMSTTINDFWRMIWENKLPTIVMVTKLVENAREKCSCYWPGAVGEELEAGPDIVILLKEIKVFTDYEIRVMSIKNVRLFTSAYKTLFGKLNFGEESSYTVINYILYCT